MNLGLDKNKELAENYCLKVGGCPKLQGLTDYNEKLSTCDGCTEILNKIDLVELLQHFYNKTSPKPLSPYFRKGKATQQSKAKIRQILTLYHVESLSIKEIALTLQLHYKTVKNIVNKEFKNEISNIKVQQVMDEMRDDCLL